MILFTDGGARGNPGPGALGVVIKDETNQNVTQFGKYLGICTNNEAEYQALIAGLNYLSENNHKAVDCFLDSELVVKQLNGQYKVKDAKLKTLVGLVLALKSNFEKITFNHIPRSKNKEADTLVNKTLDGKL